jgi:hypothetical protein
MHTTLNIDHSNLGCEEDFGVEVVEAKERH